ncbi:thioredoxin family protein (plasmid) [Enterococcus faecalis]|uniref:thioredoxin family protein n=1 Tax=Enterococcus faecalis TaxID=1351 RepID=UPI0029C7A845|nr:thioredoxin family protein [Enterococcus faecalis]WPH48346.1 thioredoxin family protein [Enterococcus faecalis]
MSVKKRLFLLCLVTLTTIVGAFTFSTVETTKQVIFFKEHDRSFVKIANNEQRTVVFYKDSCQECQKVFPFLFKENLAHDNLLFVNLNQEENQRYISTYQLTSVPTFVGPNGRYEGTDTEEIRKLLAIPKERFSLIKKAKQVFQIYDIYFKEST